MLLVKQTLWERTGAFLSSTAFYKNVKIIVVIDDFQKKLLNFWAQIFNYFNTLNFIIIFNDSVDKVFLYNKFSDAATIYNMKQFPGEVNFFFPNKLRNMHGYNYRALIMEQAPRLTSHNQIFSGIDISIFSEISRKQNASIRFYKIQQNDPERNKKFSENLNLGNAELTLNTVFYAIRTMSYRQFINTYDTNGYCALVPVPTRLSFLQFLLTPYDWFSWFSMISLTIICAIFWKLLSRGNSNTPGHFVFGVVANFFGQSIPFRDSRRMQTTLLQLCIIMTFIMGNAYQSLIIASMSTSRDGIRFKTFDEMFKSDFKFKVDPRLYGQMKSSGDFVAVTDRMETMPDFVNFESSAKERSAVIGRCDILDALLNSERNAKIADYYYMLPDQVMPFYEQLMLARASPFYDQLQMYHDIVFESGIRQFWKSIFVDKQLEKLEREENFIKNEEYLLTMDDVHGVFYILLIGCTSSLIVFLLEIMFDKYSRTSFGKLANIRRALTRWFARKRFFSSNRVQPFFE